jgi:hypothetical protein
MPFYEVGEYVCSLEEKLTGNEITQATIPVSVTRMYIHLQFLYTCIAISYYF